MKEPLLLRGSALLLGALFAPVLAQVAFAQGVPPGQAQETTQGRALGVVQQVDADARQILLKSDTGAGITISLDARASFRRVAPGETNLTKAATITLADIHAGDRVLARGKNSEDQKTLAATLVVVMSQADIASKQAGERADWDRRGVTGIVTDASADKITIQMRTVTGVTPLVIKAAPNAIVRRYAPDSVKFSEAKASKFSDVQKGDQVRARGDKTSDGMEMTAEEIVSGQFKMIAGLVISVDTKENIVLINNIETKKPLMVKFTADSSIKKLPPQLAQGIATRLHGGTGAPAGNPAASNPAGTSQSAPNQATPNQSGSDQAGRGPGARGGDLQALIDRIPAITVGDLMTGDAIIVSSTVGTSADQVTAITLIAGVEAILTKPGTREMSLGDWSVGGDLGGGFGQ